MKAPGENWLAASRFFTFVYETKGPGLARSASYIYGAPF